MKLELKCSAFADGAAIPRQFTADGKDQSPPLQWTNPPEGTQSLALICEDPDAPRGTWVHWVQYGIPAHVRELNEGVPAQATLPNGAKQGTNDFRKIGYGGPAPPPGKAHRYFFHLYALDQPIELEPGATKPQLVDAMRGHILAEGQCMGIYGRSPR